MWYKILITLSAILNSAIFYRLGGMSKEEAKKHHIPPFLAKSWVRDWLCPLFCSVVLLCFFKLQNPFGWLMLFISYGLTGGALSTYWDWLFGGKDNFYMHGFMCGLASFPLIWAGIHWYAVLASAIVSGLAMGYLCDKTGDVWEEELGRGAILAATRLLLLI